MSCVSVCVCVCRWQPVSSPEQERQLLNAVYDMYASGALPRALEYVTADVVGAAA